MTTEPDISTTTRPRKLRVAAAAATVVAALGLAGVYGIAGFARNPDAGLCSAAKASAQRIAPLARGEVAAVTVPNEPRLLPELAFNDADGKRKTTADWRGRTILLNLWATWCQPCRHEMPALDALQSKLGGQAFEVVAVNIDTRDPAKPRTWLNENKINRLAYYSDSQAKIFQDLKAAGKAFGMPTTVLIDPAGCELGTLAGPADWSSEGALALIKAALGN